MNCQRWTHPTCFFPRFSFRCESSETGSAPDWTLLSLTSAVISHGCWLSNNDCLSGRLSAAQNPVLSALIGTHIFAQDHIKHCPRSPLQGIMGIWVPCHIGWQGLHKRSMAASNTNMGSKIDWKNHSNKRGRPWSAASPFKAESILLSAFLYPPFAPLLLRFSVLAGEQKVRGTFPGAASFTAYGPKGSRAKHKGSGHCHSPQSPTIVKATFQSKMPPPRLTLPHPLRTGTGQSGPPWDTSSGRSHVSTSATHRMWNMRGGLVQLELGVEPWTLLWYLVVKGCHIFNQSPLYDINNTG